MPSSSQTQGAALSTSTESRKTLVTVLALAAGGLSILLASVFAEDSVGGGGPTAWLVVLRVVVLAISAGAYVAVMLYYGRRNAALKAQLESAMDTAPTKGGGKRKKKK